MNEHTSGLIMYGIVGVLGTAVADDAGLNALDKSAGLYQLEIETPVPLVGTGDYQEIVSCIEEAGGTVDRMWCKAYDPTYAYNSYTTLIGFRLES